MATRELRNNHECCDCSNYKSYDKPVHHNLAMTPAKVRELTAKGIAVSLSAVNNDNFQPTERGNFDIDPLFTRGMDQNTLWENAETSRRKILASRDKLTKEQRVKRDMSKRNT